MWKKTSFILLCVAVVLAAGEDSISANKSKFVENNKTEEVEQKVDTPQVITITKKDNEVKPKSPVEPTMPTESAPTTVSESTPEPSPTTPPPTSESTFPSTSDVPVSPTLSSTTASDATTKDSKTTTPTPTTSTVVPVTTTVKPPTGPGNWFVNGTTGYCIVVKMAVELNITYPMTNKTGNVVLHLPKDNKTAVATGICGAIEQNITISWPSDIVNNSLTLHFIQNATSKNYDLHCINVTLSSSNFPNISSNASVNLVHQNSHFSVGVGNSYRCLRTQHLKLTKVNSNVTLGSFDVSDLQFQAFKTDKSLIFGFAEDCSLETPDIVPIAVGCALAALVVIVLVAYLVGRRRTQARGYLSM
ncbi:lysosome-associated membrane glycoprotein 1 [Orussus abietinus]|uniref:lysosome-associated membrane glycoprotein 1 n=1 Tax=Orussus abietinus TaxID=222816 RepID=UPI000625693F|nr:lysosome-associated membrane glycoprotein 1 [Orussus abietinus]